MDARVPVEELIGILKGKGYDGMLVSDHNSYKGYRAWRDRVKGKKHEGFVVLKGIEYDTIDAGHILVIMPETVELKILELRGLPVRVLIDVVHRRGGILGPAHPCGERYLSLFRTGRNRYRKHILRQFDFLEGFNACENEKSNERALRIVRHFGKPAFGGSDAHREDCAGLAYTWFPCDIRKESDLIACVRAGEGIVCGGSYYRGTTKEKIGKANELLVQSFWVYNRCAGLVRKRRRRKEMREFDSEA